MMGCWPLHPIYDVNDAPIDLPCRSVAHLCSAQLYEAALVSGYLVYGILASREAKMYPVIL